jgi:hypothetical protein
VDRRELLKKHTQFLLICDSPDLSRFTYMNLGISRDFFAEEVNVGTCWKNLTEPLVIRFFPSVTSETSVEIGILLGNESVGNIKTCEG